MGNKLYNQVLDETGIRHLGVETEFGKLLSGAQISPDNMTLEDLRQVMAEYLQDVLLEMHQAHSNENK